MTVSRVGGVAGVALRVFDVAGEVRLGLNRWVPTAVYPVNRRRHGDGLLTQSRMPIHWAYYPQSSTPPAIVRGVVDAFGGCLDDIDSERHAGQDSNAVLAELRSPLEAIGFQVEAGKKRDEQIRVPVLYGRDGKVEKSCEADAYHVGERFVLEVEAGRAVANHQFLKDLFQACMMQNVDRLGIAARNTYRGSRDFERMATWFDTLYASRRLALPLEGVLLIGY